MRNERRVLCLRIEKFGAEAQRQLIKAIKDTKKSQKRGKPCGNGNATLRKDRNDVITEIRRRRRETKHPLTQVIREMRSDSTYSARMRSVSVSSWRAPFLEYLTLPRELFYIRKANATMCAVTGESRAKSLELGVLK